ncbi:MAG TPA: T9SS type A sorting domain-containing protein, partial [Chitinophagales bacterium]|nr:T9SS type A sorting domain-containing protein [Chitinophagales bacterium]
STNRNIFLLNENERSAIQNLADNGEGIAKVRACNILSFVYGTECNYNLKLPETNHFFKTDNAPAGKDNPLLPFINAFPNPAKDYIEFSYNLPVGAMEGTLSITDLKGIVIHKQQLTAKYGQIAIDTRQWQQGAYLYILSANGKMVANHKFVLIK